MRRGLGKDIQVLLAQAEEQGWEARLSGGDHIRLQGPQGQLVFLSQTPSDRRSLLNAKACLRRAGLELPHTHRKKKS